MATRDELLARIDATVAKLKDRAFPNHECPAESMAVWNVALYDMAAELRTIASTAAPAAHGGEAMATEKARALRSLLELAHAEFFNAFMADNATKQSQRRLQAARERVQELRALIDGTTQPKFPQEARAEGVPAGWKLVPETCTPEMAGAGSRAARNSDVDGHRLLAIWRGMLDASPEPPTAAETYYFPQPGSPDFDGAEAYEAYLRSQGANDDPAAQEGLGLTTVRFLSGGEVRMDVADYRRLYAAAQPVGEVDEAMARRLDDYLGGEFDICIGKQAAHAALTAALHPTPNDQVKP